MTLEEQAKAVFIQSALVELIKQNRYLLGMKPAIKTVLTEWANYSHFDNVVQELKK